MLKEKLKILRGKLKEWNEEVFGDIYEKRKLLIRRWQILIRRMKKVC